MRVVIGSDHAGFALKASVVAELTALGHDVIDKGAFNTQPVDYPDYAEAVGQSVRSGEADRGVLLCGSGVGASVAANKMPGVRAAVCHDTYSAHQGVEHDDMNVLALGARVIGPEVAIEAVRAFIGARFSGEERHVRRLTKVLAIEKRFAGHEEAIDG
ncbi:MAG TPA: ribose 5-phosphate isomerase B [Dehalococcoidia bacterium]|nr:ribose 5-phosphate isomerase B [Dehalococcoidia bacterium]